jgi:DNA-binding CsgD family transcriptional regulator
MHGPLSKLSKHDLIVMLELVDDILRVKKRDDLLGVLGRLGAHVPTQGIIGVAGTLRPGMSTGLGPGPRNAMRGHGFELRDWVHANIARSGWTDEWFSEYRRRNYFAVDPTARLLSSINTFWRWSDAFAAAQTKSEKKFVSHARECGVHDGVNVRAGALTHGDSYCFALLGTELGKVDRHEIMLSYLAPYLTEAMRDSEQRGTAQARAISPLSPREAEVLRWAMAGKTNWEISVILAISESTVKFHVQNAKSKLQAVSRAHAVAIALGEGLISR